MLFDKVCKIAENELPELEKELRRTKLFHFPGKPHEFLPKEIDEEIVLFLKDQFMLPFQSVAIEDDAGLVILEDLKKDTRGIDHERKFIDIVKLTAPNEVFREGHDSNMNIIKGLGITEFDPVTITYGAIEKVSWTDTTNFFALGRIDRAITGFIKPYEKKYIYSDYDISRFHIMGKEAVQKQLESSLMNAMTAIQEVLYANTPNKFILETTLSKRKKKSKENKIPRSLDRPIYTLLRPNQIRKLMKLDNITTESGRKSPKGHDRRAHPRTFHSERFINMKGKTIMIPARWIGPTESIVKNRIYKVMIDM